MNPSAQILRRWAVETGWRPEALEKVVRLGSVAGDVFRHPALRDALALKGGTALNLGYGPPTRLSVDLDLNYVGRSDREAMLAERPAIEGALVALAERGGYRVQQTADAFAGRTLHLRYRSALGPPDRVEVDLNYLYRQPIEECEATLLWQPPGLDPVPVRTCSLTEIVVGKLLALLDRGAPRDLWDVAHLPPVAHQVLAGRRLRALFIALSAALPHPLLRYTVARLRSRLSDDDVRDHLWPMLVDGQRPTAADLLEGAWSVVGPLVDLTEAERAYVDHLSRGAVRTELLFPDEPAVARRIALHPVIQWKASNARGRPPG